MWHLYKFIDKSGRDVIRKWMAKSIQKPDLARLERKLEALQDQGPDLSSDLLSDTPSRKIKKIRVNGRVAIRLLLCRGPIGSSEFTLLYGAKEENRKFVPRDAVARAENNRQEVINDPDNRRQLFDPTEPASEETP